MALMLLISWSLGPAPAAARWASDEDVAFEIEDQNVDTVVHADGTWEDVTETRTRVLKDSARTAVAIERFGYNANIQTFEVAEAYTVVGGRTVPVDPQRIEDKPMASTPFGFDELHQVMVPFPEVEVGASVVTQIRAGHEGGGAAPPVVDRARAPDADRARRRRRDQRAGCSAGRGGGAPRRPLTSRAPSPTATIAIAANTAPAWNVAGAP